MDFIETLEAIDIQLNTFNRTIRDINDIINNTDNYCNDIELEEVLSDYANRYNKLLEEKNTLLSLIEDD